MLRSDTNWNASEQKLLRGSPIRLLLSPENALPQVPFQSFSVKNASYNLFLSSSEQLNIKELLSTILGVLHFLTKGWWGLSQSILLPGYWFVSFFLLLMPFSAYLVHLLFLSYNLILQPAAHLFLFIVFYLLGGRQWEFWTCSLVKILLLLLALISGLINQTWVVFAFFSFDIRLLQVNFRFTFSIFFSPYI